LEVRAAGELRSVTRRELFAPADGIVAELRIDHGQQVRKNDLLLVVHSPELDRQWQEAHSVADGLQRQLASVQSQRLQARAGDTASRQRAAALAAEEEQLLTQRKSQLELVALLEDRRESLQVRSPMAGRIITWGVRDRLAGRPLRRGDPLLTIAGDGGPFELELRVPERVAGRVLAAAQGETGGHRVAWTLASRPETPRHGTVCELSRRIDFDSLGGGFLRVRVALAEDQELETAPRELGETVAAKVACGRVSLAESWFFELIDTARRWWWL
jgi:biotin carboxyl carrier protein